MSEHDCVAEKLDSLKVSLKEAKADNRISKAEYADLAGLAFELLGHALQCSGDHERYKELAKDLQDLYVEYIKPMDLPGVPNWIEATVDGIIANNIPTAVEAIHAWLHDH